MLPSGELRCAVVECYRRRQTTDTGEQNNTAPTLCVGGPVTNRSRVSLRSAFCDNGYPHSFVHAWLHWAQILHECPVLRVTLNSAVRVITEFRRRPTRTTVADRYKCLTTRRLRRRLLARWKHAILPTLIQLRVIPSSVGGGRGHGG